MAFITEKIAHYFKKVLPSPFSIALVLTGVIAFMAFTFVKPASTGWFSYLGQVAGWWEGGLWNPGLIVFAFQMMLMLVLGHVLALTKPIAWLIDQFTSRFCQTTASAAYTVTLLTILVSLFNWGMGLVFGAIFARKVGERFTREQQPLNYGLIGACGYVGLMVWHGGLSGSSLIKVAEPGHLRSIMASSLSPSQLETLPDAIPMSATLGSSMNLIVTLVLIIVLPLLMYFIGKRAKGEVPNVKERHAKVLGHRGISGAEKMDYSHWVGGMVGLVILGVAFFRAATGASSFLGFITPNWINLLLFGMGLLLHRQIASFLWAVEKAIGGATGILIQFPLYFGIMGIMKGSGMVEWLSEGLLASGSSDTLTLVTFCSAGIVNVFVPSGGGQWAVQGPIIVNAALESGIPLNKMILSLAYGDQLTNMLQPFWALPLLGITGLKAKTILPYTLVLLVAGVIIFGLALWI